VVLELLLVVVDEDAAEVAVADVEAKDAVTNGVALEPAKCEPSDARDEDSAEITELTAVDANDASGVTLVVDVEVDETGF